MKITIERAALLKSLGHVQSVVERRNTIPILSNVKLSAKDGKLSLNATDMDLDIVAGVAAEVAQPGATTASAHTLYEFVRRLPDGAQVEMEAGDGTLALRSGRANGSLACLPTEDFPVMASGDPTHGFEMPVGDLKALIDHTRFAISTEETRYYLNGVYLHAAERDGSPVLRAVATDGHRLALSEGPLPDGATGMPGVIVPRKAVAEIRKLIEDVTGDVRVDLSESKIRFSFEDAVMTSKLIDGTFPDYQRVIPEGNDKVLETDCAGFIKAVELVSSITSEKSRAIKLGIEGSAMTLSASSSEQGSATYELEVQHSGDGLEIGFNARYLLDIAQQIESGNLRFTFADSASPTIIQDVDDQAALYVLMPMRV
ncbi:MAG: DNA polymerase III subunit beta [Rhodospirillales bacterium]